MAKFKATCPRCSTGYQIDESLAGKQGRCRKCGNSFVVARAEQGRETVAAAAPRADETTGIWRPGDVILNLYEVKQVHEGGGMGLVYRVHHKGWNVDLAVKSPRPEFFRNERDKENFEREAETWVKLGLHPHTVSCYYVRRLDGIPRVFAEYVEGGTLGEAIHSGKLYEGGPEPALTRILDIAIQFAWGLKYAHEQGLVHQDVKPANVLLTKDGTAKVTDFGLARARGVGGTAPATDGQKSILVSTGGMTPAYCSPEQAAGDKLTRKTDLWSWAASILEMFTGDVTWPSGTVAGEALEGYLETADAADGMPRMPMELAALLRRCFHREPEERPSDMLEVLPLLLFLYKESAEREYPRPAPRAAAALADSLNNRAVSLLDLGKQDEAAALWQKALEADPHHAEAAFNLGLTDWRAGKINDLALVHKLKEVNATHAGEWLPAYLLAQVHWERGDCQAAIQILESIGGADAQRGEVREALAQARARLGQSRRQLHMLSKEVGLVQAVCFSPDGRLALLGGSGFLQLWNLADGNRVRTFEGLDSSVAAVCMSRDGRYALSGSEDNTLRLWDVGSGQCSRAIKVRVKFARGVGLSADNRHALIAGENEPMQWLEVATGRVVRTFAKESAASTAALSPDGRIAVIGNTDNVLRLWDIATGEQLRQFVGHNGWIKAAALSADGRFALSGCDDRTARVWDVASGKCLRILVGHTKDVTGVAFTPDARHALTGCEDGTVKLWNTATGSCVRTFEGHAEAVFCAAVSGDGRFGLSGGRDHTARLWSLPWSETAALMISQVQTGEKAEAAGTKFDLLVKQGEEALERGDDVGAARHLREARSQPGYARKPEVMNLWAKLYGRLPRVSLRAAWQENQFLGHKHAVYALCPSRDGRFLLSAGSDDHSLRYWELATGQCLREIKADTSVKSVCFSPDGKLAFSGGLDDHVRVWDLATAKPLGEFRGHTWRVWGLDCSKDGRFVLSAGGDKTLKLWDVASGKCLRTFEGHTDQIWSACLGPDDRLALSGSGDGTVKLWEVATAKCLRTFEGHSGNATVTGVRMSGDGRFALSSSEDHTLKQWDMATGRCLRTFQGHKNHVKCVDLSSDGRYAVSGSDDGEVKLWEIATGECVRTFEGHRDEVHAVFITADGRYLGSAAGKDNHEGEIHVWTLDWELEDRPPADWDEGARPYLKVFLSRHIKGKPAWNDGDFQGLLGILGRAGFGHLRPQGVRGQLDGMAAGAKAPDQPTAAAPVRPITHKTKKPTAPAAALPTSTQQKPAAQKPVASAKRPVASPAAATAKRRQPQEARPAEPAAPPAPSERLSPETKQSIIGGVVLLLASILAAVFLVLIGWGWLALAPGFLAVVWLLGILGIAFKTSGGSTAATPRSSPKSKKSATTDDDGEEERPASPAMKLFSSALAAWGEGGGSKVDNICEMIKASQEKSWDGGVHGAGNSGTMLSQLGEGGGAEGIAGVMTLIGKGGARKLGAALRSASKGEVEQMARLLLAKYSDSGAGVLMAAIAVQPAEPPPPPEPEREPEPEPVGDTSNLERNLLLIAQSPHLNQTGRNNLAAAMKLAAERAKNKGK
jgi:predicted Zn finger-like uncharacterized protein